MVMAELENWETTRDTLHQVAQVVGAVRAACSDPLPNDLHYSLDLLRGGFSTTRMRCGGELRFDARAFEVAFLRNGERVFALKIVEHSQKSLMQRLLSIYGDCGYVIAPSMKHIVHDTPLSADRGLADDYFAVLDAMCQALSRVRGKIGGKASPIALWPHHFDVGFVAFPTADTDEKTAPQIAFGFAPFSPGLERPYVYAYAWSAPTGYLQLPVNPPAQAIADAYTGLYAPFDELRASADFGATIETMLCEFFQAAEARLGS